MAALLEARAVVSFDCLGKAESAYGEQSTMHRLLMEPLEDRSRRELTLKIQLSMVSSGSYLSIVAPWSSLTPLRPCSAHSSCLHVQLHLTPGSKLCEEFHALWRNEHGMTDERIKVRCCLQGSHLLRGVLLMLVGRHLCSSACRS